MNTVETRIKNATYELIKSKPFQNVTAEEIIKTAKVAKASFYYYFKDKYDVGTTVFKDIILPSLADPKYKEFRWSCRIKQIYKKLIEERDYVVNLLASENMRPTFLYLTRYYCSMLTAYVANFNGDIESIEIKKAIHNCSQTDMMVVYYYCTNKITGEQLENLGKHWAETSPHALYRYIK